MAIAAWRKEQRVRMLQTIATVVAHTNPQKAQEALSNLLEEMFPEVAIDKKSQVERALAIMEKESKTVYVARPLDEKKNQGWVKKTQKALGSK